MRGEWRERTEGGGDDDKAAMKMIQMIMKVKADVVREATGK